MEKKQEGAYNSSPTGVDISIKQPIEPHPEPHPETLARTGGSMNSQQDRHKLVAYSNTLPKRTSTIMQY